jgi:uncharacterized membrane protein
MNTTHLHLLLNHFPIIGTLIGSGLLLWGLIRKQNNLKVTAAFVLLVMALIAIPVYLTGGPAEESTEKLPGVSEAMVELHEEAAIIAIWLIGITGVLSLAALLFSWQKRKATNTVFVFVFAISLVCFAAMARTGYYGGQIRHTEIRNSNVAQNENQTGKEVNNKEGEKDDD